LACLALTSWTAACSASEESAPAAPGHALAPVTIAFAGDVHFAGQLAGRLDDPATAMGPLASVLGSADLAMVNLETAVTTRGAPQPKEFTFRSPPVVFSALKNAGVDVVTMANNHALDYGPDSVPDALAAASAADMPVVGLGGNEEQAYAPWIATVKGSRIAVLGATAVVDDSLVSSWSAGPSHGGVATALDGQNTKLVAAVSAARAKADTVIVELHYGKDLTTCPTAVQRKLAGDLVAAGADIVVGQHAHVLLGGGFLGPAYVHYGMGNFQFYASNGGAKTETGVLVLTAAGRAVSDPQWHPGRVVDGLPTPLNGDEGSAATARWEGLRDCAGLTSAPVAPS
jgi:poly-gamma-glutamate synthesis protein (capsule biosynthesis protein)